MALVRLAGGMAVAAERSHAQLISMCRSAGWLLVLDKVLGKVLEMSAMLLVLGASLLVQNEEALVLGDEALLPGILLLVVRQRQEVDEDVRAELRVAMGEVYKMAREVLLVVRRVTRMVVMRHFETHE